MSANNYHKAAVSMVLGVLGLYYLRTFLGRYRDGVGCHCERCYSTHTVAQWRSLMPEDQAFNRSIREQVEQAVKDTTIHGVFNVEYVTASEYYNKIVTSLPGMERVLMYWDPVNPNLMYCLDVRQIHPSSILQGSEHGIVWITLSPSGEITRTPST